MLTCQRCGIKIFQKTIKLKKFCSIKCRSQFNVIVRYERLKNDPDYKEKARVRFKEWYLKNKEKHNIYMKEYMRSYYKEQNETTSV